MMWKTDEAIHTLRNMSCVVVHLKSMCLKSKQEKEKKNRLGMKPFVLYVKNIHSQVLITFVIIQLYFMWWPGVLVWPAFCFLLSGNYLCLVITEECLHLSKNVFLPRCLSFYLAFSLSANLNSWCLSRIHLCFHLIALHLSFVCATCPMETPTDLFVFGSALS